MNDERFCSVCRCRIDEVSEVVYIHRYLPYHICGRCYATEIKNVGADMAGKLYRKELLAHHGVAGGRQHGQERPAPSNDNPYGLSK